MAEAGETKCEEVNSGFRELFDGSCNGRRSFSFQSIDYLREIPASRMTLCFLPILLQPNLCKITALATLQTTQ